MKKIVREEALLLGTKQIAIGIETEMNRQLKIHQLTAAQAFLIVHIYTLHPEGTYVTTLHKEFGVSKATISGLVKRLREKGYLNTSSEQDDERHRKFIMTEKLTEEVLLLKKIMKRLEQQIFGALTSEEQDSLKYLQEKILLQIIKLEEGKENENNIEPTRTV